MEDCLGRTSSDGGGAMLGEEEGCRLVEGSYGGMVEITVRKEEGFRGRVLCEDEH